MKSRINNYNIFLFIGPGPDCQENTTVTTSNPTTTTATTMTTITEELPSTTESDVTPEEDAPVDEEEPSDEYVFLILACIDRALFFCSTQWRLNGRSLSLSTSYFSSLSKTKFRVL